MFIKYLTVATIVVYVCVINVHGRPQQDATAPTTEATTWDKIKKGVEHGWQVVYDESHCALHKVKELVEHHEHQEGSDPCVNKPYQQSTTVKTISLTASEVVPVTSSP